MPGQTIAVVAEGRRDATLGLLRQLIALGREGEAAVQGHVAERLGAVDCRVDALQYRPDRIVMKDEFASASAMSGEERVSVVARKAGAGGGRSMILFAHPDSEPVAGLERWRHDPFAGVIEGGRIHGWGVADDLAGVAQMVAAMEVLHAAGLTLQGDVVLASTPSKRHARGVAAVLQHGHVADAAVYFHPAESGVGFAEIKAFSSGLLGYEIVVAGSEPATSEPGHTVFTHRAVNPAEKAMLVIRTLIELGERRAARVRHPRLERAIGRSTNVLVAGISCGSGQIDRIGPSCTVTGSVSFPPGEPMGAVRAEVEAALAAAAAADPWLADHPPALRWISGVAGAAVEDDHPLFVTAAEAIAAVFGQPPHFNPLHTASDIRVPMIQAGIPTIGLGPLGGDLSQNGRHDEWVDVEDYLRGVAIAAGLIAQWCRAAPPR